MLFASHLCFLICKMRVLTAAAGRYFSPFLYRPRSTPCIFHGSLLHRDLSCLPLHFLCSAGLLAVHKPLSRHQTFPSSFQRGCAAAFITGTVSGGQSCLYACCRFPLGSGTGPAPGGNSSKRCLRGRVLWVRKVNPLDGPREGWLSVY